MGKYTFFFGGEFSQHYIRPFQLDGMIFNCAEQYMMASKALLFDDMFVYNEIMNEKSPHNQKMLGRKIKNFDKEKWELIAKYVVYRANLAKFTQHRDLYDVLMATEGTELVEASPIDTIWGIGLSESDPLIHDKANWKGTNWLGQILTLVRTDIGNSICYA